MMAKLLVLSLLIFHFFICGNSILLILRLYVIDTFLLGISSDYLCKHDRPFRMFGKDRVIIGIILLLSALHKVLHLLSFVLPSILAGSGIPGNLLLKSESWPALKRRELLKILPGSTFVSIVLINHLRLFVLNVLVARTTVPVIVVSHPLVRLACIVLGVHV